MGAARARDPRNSFRAREDVAWIAFVLQQFEIAFAIGLHQRHLVGKRVVVARLRVVDVPDGEPVTRQVRVAAGLNEGTPVAVGPPASLADGGKITVQAPPPKPPEPAKPADTAKPAAAATKP